MSRHGELLVKPLHGEPFHFPLDKDVIRIGRSMRSDLVFADRWLARHHAEIRADGDLYFIQDLESRNGTYVNGQRIERGVQLRNGDIIAVGDQQLNFFDDASFEWFIPERLNLDGTWVVPSSELLSAARAHEGTRDNSSGERGARFKPDAGNDFTRVKEQNQVVTTLNACEALLSSYSVNEALEFILELALIRTHAERGVLISYKDGEPVPRAIRGWSICLDRRIAEHVATKKVSILSNNTLRDPQLDYEPIISLGFYSAMYVPLWHDDTVVGLIYVDSAHRENVFTRDDLILMTFLANNAAIKLKNVTPL